MSWIRNNCLLFIDQADALFRNFTSIKCDFRNQNGFTKSPILIVEYCLLPLHDFDESSHFRYSNLTSFQCSLPTNWSELIFFSVLSLFCPQLFFVSFTKATRVLFVKRAIIIFFFFFSLTGDYFFRDDSLDATHKKVNKCTFQRNSFLNSIRLKQTRLASIGYWSAVPHIDCDLR